MKIKLYQINPTRDKQHRMFRSLDKVASFVDCVPCIDSSIYDKVFDGEVDAHDLEGVYMIFNVHRPDGYIGRSLSISDVVEVECDPVNGGPVPGFFYCDTVGFKKVEFKPGDPLRYQAEIVDRFGAIATIKDRDKALEELWKVFGDIPMDPETECIEENFNVDPCSIEYRSNFFPAGTHREEIWKWFDERHSRGVAWLLYHNLEGSSMDSVEPKYFQRMKLCKACDSELCIFNPDGICMFPMITGRLAKIDDNGCHACVCNDADTAAVAESPSELVIDLGGDMELVSQMDTSVKKVDGTWEELNTLYISLRNKETDLMQDVVMVRGSNQLPDGPTSVDCKVWTDESSEDPTESFEIPIYREPAEEEDEKTNCELGLYDCNGCTIDGQCDRQAEEEEG